MSMPCPHAACDQSPPIARRLESESGDCATTMPGVVPVRSAPSTTIGADAPPSGDSVTVYGPAAEPVTVAAAHGVPSARTALWIVVAATALYASAPVVAPPRLMVKVPPLTVPVSVMTCTREPERV